MGKVLMIGVIAIIFILIDLYIYQAVKTSIVVLPPVAAKSPTPPPSQRAPGQVPSVTISSFSESRNRVVAALGLSDVIGVG